MAPKSSQELSCEEEAELNRNNKKIKESHQSETVLEASLLGASLHAHYPSHGAKQTFKDKLISEIPGAYIQAFDFSEYVDDVMESDSEVEALRQGVATINLSKGLKQRIRAHWSNALIIKVYGRSVGFSFLHSKILSLWKPIGKLDYVDLSCDFYFVRFSLKEDHDLVLKKGLWFIREHFLSVRPWEPNFRPDTADIASVVVWVRLPKLPIEYYDLEALKEIGNAIGTKLRIDTHTLGFMFR